MARAAGVRCTRCINARGPQAAAGAQAGAERVRCGAHLMLDASGGGTRITRHALEPMLRRYMSTSGSGIVAVRDSTGAPALRGGGWVGKQRGRAGGERGGGRVQVALHAQPVRQAGRPPAGGGKRGCAHMPRMMWRSRSGGLIDRPHASTTWPSSMAQNAMRPSVAICTWAGAGASCACACSRQARLASRSSGHGHASPSLHRCSHRG